MLQKVFHRLGRYSVRSGGWSLAIAAVLLAGCSRQSSYQFLQRVAVEVGERARSEQDPADRFGFRLRGSCGDPANYIPDPAHLEHTPVRYVRVNFHFIDTEDRLYNYPEEETERFIEGLLVSANKDLAQNNALWLPYGNTLPVLPVRYQMVRTPAGTDADDRGIYHHYVADELAFYVHRGANRNLSDRRLIDRFGIAPDSILNIFIMPHHPDSVVSPTYNAGAVGVMVGNAIKLAGFYEGGQPAWAYRGVLNHEVGHIFGLAHAWGSDGCEDTPVHTNACWNRTDSPPCDTAASNNVMDYNALQNAWSPCQVGKIRYNMSREDGRRRGLLRPDWCRLDTTQTITISDTVQWNSEKDLNGHLVIAPGGVLTLECRLSLPPGGKITVHAGGMLILEESARLHNSCGMEWQGIEVEKKGNESGRVVFHGAPVIEQVLHPLE